MSDHYVYHMWRIEFKRKNYRPFHILCSVDKRWQSSWKVFDLCTDKQGSQVLAPRANYWYDWVVKLFLNGKKKKEIKRKTWQLLGMVGQEVWCRYKKEHSQRHLGVSKVNRTWLSWFIWGERGRESKRDNQDGKARLWDWPRDKAA